MPWCPKCRRFQEDNDLCAYCWVKVVDTLPPEHPDPGKEILLVSAGDENEANFIQGFLESHGIYSLRRYRESGGYLKVYLNMSSFGIDIYVTESDLHMAKELLQTKPDNAVDESEEMQGFVEENIVKRQDMARFLLIFMLIPAFAGIFLIIISTIGEALRR